MMLYYQERYDYDKLYANFKYNDRLILSRTRMVPVLFLYTNIVRFDGCQNILHYHAYIHCTPKFNFNNRKCDNRLPV